MSPSKTKKNTKEWKNSPAGVGQPPLDIVKNLPNTICVTLYVSGLAIKKKISAL